MIRPFEKKILKDIHFVERFVNARNLCVRNGDCSYRLQKKDIKDVLSRSGYQFENVKSQYVSNLKEGDLTFRLLFDIKGDSVLTYMYVLRGDEFLNNGLSHFGFMLNSFDLGDIEINQNFGFNNIIEFSEYMGKMISIFEDFRKEFMKREKPD